MEYPNSKTFLLRGDFSVGDSFWATVDYDFKEARITYSGAFVVVGIMRKSCGRFHAEVWAVNKLNHCLSFLAE